MSEIIEILTELTAMMKAGVISRERGNAAKRYILEHPNDFFYSETSPMSVSEAADMAVELSHARH